MRSCVVAHVRVNFGVVPEWQLANRIWLTLAPWSYPKESSHVDETGEPANDFIQSNPWMEK